MIIPRLKQMRGKHGAAVPSFYSVVLALLLALATYGDSRTCAIKMAEVSYNC